MSEWKTKPLGDVISFKSGKSIKPGVLGKFPVYGSNGIIGYSDEYRCETAIIIGRVGAYCGSIEYCPGKFWASDNTLTVTPKDDGANTKFLYYFLGAANLRNFAGGAAQPLVTQTVLKQVPVSIPPLAEQKRIAGILSAYDDLIENNLRRIKILEDMAQSLYREWFVHFRYPSHESTPLTDSPLGPIPQGWEVNKLGEITDILSRGMAPKYAEDGDSIIINQKCIRDRRVNLSLARRQSKVIKEEKLVRNGDVLINSTGVGTLGRVAQVTEELSGTTADTHVTIARPSKGINLHYFGCLMMDLQPTFEHMGAGATGQTELRRAEVCELSVLIPPVSLQEQYAEKVSSMRLLQSSLYARNENLRTTRDLLLPKLLTPTTA